MKKLIKSIIFKTFDTENYLNDLNLDVLAILNRILFQF